MWWFTCVSFSQTVVVLDPDLSKDYLDLIQNRTKERRCTFDHVYPPGCSNSVCKSAVCSALICNCLACFWHMGSDAYYGMFLESVPQLGFFPNCSFLVCQEMMLWKTKPPATYLDYEFARIRSVSCFGQLKQYCWHLEKTIAQLLFSSVYSQPVMYTNG